MRTSISLLTLLSALLLVSCSSDLQIETDMDKDADFDNYSSFFFLPWNEENSKIINPVDRDILMNQVKVQLMDRGHAYNEERGDLAVSLFVVLEDKSSTSAYTSHYSGYGYGPYNPGWGWGGGYPTTHYSTHHYVVGTLVVDVFDESNKRLIWQGVASKTVDENPNSRDRTIPRVIDYLFKEYPRAKIKN